MKANGAPEKIYVHELSAQELSTKLDAYHIEYTRTDAFIYKLECWMNENFYQYAGEFDEGILASFNRTEEAIEDFKNYMKEE